MTKKQAQSNREILEAELAKFSETRPFRRPVEIVHTMATISVLDAVEKTNELLARLIQTSGGSIPEDKPMNFLNKIFRKKKKK